MTKKILFVKQIRKIKPFAFLGFEAFLAYAYLSKKSWFAIVFTTFQIRKCLEVFKEAKLLFAQKAFDAVVISDSR